MERKAQVYRIKLAQLAAKLGSGGEFVVISKKTFFKLSPPYRCFSQSALAAAVYWPAINTACELNPIFARFILKASD